MSVRIDPDVARSDMLAAGFSPLEPFTDTKTPWRCRCLAPDCGLVSTPTLGNVRHRKSRCKYCAGKAVDPDVALALVTEAGWEPLEEFRLATRPWPCRCLACGETTGVYIKSVRNGVRCGVCQSRRIPPEVAEARVRELGYEPLEPYPGSNKFPWLMRHLECGDEVTPTYNGIAGGKQGGCLRCGRERTRQALMLDALWTVEQVRGRAAEPLEPYPGVDKHWRISCLLCEQESTIKYRQMVRSNDPACDYCAGRGPDLEALHLLMTTSGAVPLVPYPGVDKVWDARCMNCNESISPRVSALRAGQGACGYCSQRRTNPARAVEVMRQRRLEPSGPYPGVDAPWPSTCLECGCHVSPSFRTVREREIGCQYCDDRVINPDVASAVMREAGFTPLSPYPGAHSPWPSQCRQCLRESAPSYSGVRAGHGCRYCADYGFDFSSPAVLYVLLHPAWQAIKIGICGADRTRLIQHGRQGWQLVTDASGRDAVWDVPDGMTAWTVEQAVLNLWRSELSPDPAIPKIAMPQGGYTETIHASYVDLEQLVDQIEARLAERSALSARARLAQ